MPKPPSPHLLTPHVERVKHNKDWPLSLACRKWYMKELVELRLVLRRWIKFILRILKCMHVLRVELRELES